MFTEIPTHNQPANNYKVLCNNIVMSDCEDVFIDSDGDGEADTFERVCNGDVVGSYSDNSPSVGVDSSATDTNQGPPWVEPLVLIVLIALALYSFRFRQRQKGFGRISTLPTTSGNVAWAPSPRVTNKQSNDLARARGAPRITDDDALICSTCGSHHGLKSDWHLTVINCDCGTLIDVSSGKVSSSTHSNSQSSSTDHLYDVWVTGIGSFKIDDGSIVEVGRLIDPNQQHLFIDSLKHNLQQLKKGSRTQVLITTRIPDTQAQKSCLRLEELGLIVKVERNYSE